LKLGDSQGNFQVWKHKNGANGESNQASTADVVLYHTRWAKRTKKIKGGEKGRARKKGKYLPFSFIFSSTSVLQMLCGNVFSSQRLGLFQ
jgi:hypothetical protein